MRYQQKRIYAWSPDIAYSVGLMASDGCLSSDGRHLDLTSVDTEQLTNFSEAIAKELKIRPKANVSNVQAYHVQFSDTSFYDFLVGIGLTPAKSKTIGRLDIPDHFYADFFRGLFDGDGTTYAYFDPRWKKSYLYYISIASASYAFLVYLAQNNQRLFGLKGISIRKSRKAYNLVYAKHDSALLYKAMYHTNSTLYLSRKKKKLDSFLEQDKNATISRLARVP